METQHDTLLSVHIQSQLEGYSSSKGVQITWKLDLHCNPTSFCQIPSFQFQTVVGGEGGPSCRLEFQTINVIDASRRHGSGRGRHDVSHQGNTGHHLHPLWHFCLPGVEVLPLVVHPTRTTASTSSILHNTVYVVHSSTVLINWLLRRKSLRTKKLWTQTENRSSRSQLYVRRRVISDNWVVLVNFIPAVLGDQ